MTIRAAQTTAATTTRLSAGILMVHPLGMVLKSVHMEATTFTPTAACSFAQDTMNRIVGGLGVERAQLLLQRSRSSRMGKETEA